jgi:hypothetical protein
MLALGWSRAARVGLLSVWLLALAGCAGVTRSNSKETIEDPQVLLQSYQKAGGQLEFRINNLGRAPVTLLALNYTLTIAGKPPVQGRMELGKTLLPGLGVEVFDYADPRLLALNYSATSYQLVVEVSIAERRRLLRSDYRGQLSTPPGEPGVLR